MDPTQHLPITTPQRLKTGAGKLEIIGTDSLLGLALLLSSPESYDNLNRPNVIILPEEEQIPAFQEALSFFRQDSKCFTLASYDVDIYANLYPAPRVAHQRLQWLHRAMNPHPGDIFVGSMRAFCQKTLPQDVVSLETSTFRVNDSLTESVFLDWRRIGYEVVNTVEDVGGYAQRGGIVDIFSPAHERPIRIELFGDLIESIRFFDPTSQRSGEDIGQFTVLPAREAYYFDEDPQAAIANYKKHLGERLVFEDDLQLLLRQMARKDYFNGIEFFLPFFFDKLASPLDYFSGTFNLWCLNPLELNRLNDEWLSELKTGLRESLENPLAIDFKHLVGGTAPLFEIKKANTFFLSKIQVTTNIEEEKPHIELHSQNLNAFQKKCRALAEGKDYQNYINERFAEWRGQGCSIFVSASSSHQAQKLKMLFEHCGHEPQIMKADDYSWSEKLAEQQANPQIVHIVQRKILESLKITDEKLVFLRDADFFIVRNGQAKKTSSEEGAEHIKAMSFAELKVGDLVVHKLHGVGIYQGLKAMDIGGIESEFIELEYKEKDKLYLPVYRIGQLTKFSGPGSSRLIDKLGGKSWEKVTTKVKKHLRDIAAELLKLYAQRAQAKRPMFSEPDSDFVRFENSFPFEETQDQLDAINAIVNDMSHRQQPMDRLVCGDVGFGKTEVAMRAAFKAVQDGFQVAILAPTTILTFQHYENFLTRFKDWPVTIKSLNRFVPKAEVKKTLDGLKNGQVDIVIGTHRLISKDVSFGKLGLLIIDEEQKFGVKHKERIRKFKVGVDTLALSATPIPRTLNMSLVGLRDLSLITTPPVDRLPTRTFVCRYEKETIRKAVEGEIQRGGQVFFIHNRVQSIDAVAAKLREILPQARMAIAHGQMDESQLEKTIVKFFNHEIDILICTTIIESGMDIPKANTMFIDDAHKFGISQLYQLRGRVGRSKKRAYCYLLIPANRKLEGEAQERLRVIKENSALGSGIRVAQYDLELRGSGDILGQEQSGHINAIGYELYLELLHDAVREQKGESPKYNEVDPDINIRIPALIPDSYIPDIRVRLAYYKELSQIQSEEDLDRIEEDLRDQFGAPPDSVINLLGLMLIRKVCKDLGVKDISSAAASMTLSFDESTPLPISKLIELTTVSHKKFKLTPENRLRVRLKNLAWPEIYEELVQLRNHCP